jgi:uncharacterized membrane protein YkvI
MFKLYMSLISKTGLQLAIVITILLGAGAISAVQLMFVGSVSYPIMALMGVAFVIVFLVFEPKKKPD